MGVMAVCGAMLLAGLVAGGLWNGREFQPPPAVRELTVGEAGRRFVWYASLALFGGVLAGVSVIGGGGRLAMRLLAVTGGDGAQGRITEADEVVGEITVGGTIGFVLFNGLFVGVAAAVVYLVIRRLLPSHRFGGLAFGLGLLVVIGTTIDPLRGDNPDFDLVGPGWLAVVAFALLAVAFGLVLAGVMARLSTWLPLLSRERSVLVRYAAPAAVAAVGFSVTAALVIVGLAVVAVTRWRPIIDAVQSTRAVLIGRVVAAVVVVAAIPNAVATLADIAAR